jgi:hypothetical protein
MKFSLATLAFIALIGITDVNGSACCLSGAVCGKRELGHVYAADTFVPKTLHERDTVVPSASDLTQRAGCCCLPRCLWFLTSVSYLAPSLGQEVAAHGMQQMT